MSEIWKSVWDWERLFEVSNRGQVRSLDRYVRFGKGGKYRRRIAGHVITGTVDNRGYRIVTLSNGGCHVKLGVHTLVLSSFVGPRPAGKECRHLDGNPLNNRLENLCWGTDKENSDDKARHGRMNTGERNGGAKLTEGKVQQIRKLYASGEYYQKHLATMFGVHKEHIGRIVRREKWGNHATW